MRDTIRIAIASILHKHQWKQSDMNWLDGIIGAALGIVGTVLVAFLKYKSDSDSTTVQARNALQDQTLNYAKQLEQQIKDLDDRFTARLEAERGHCELQLETQALQYERRIAELETEVKELKEAVKLRKSPRSMPNSSTGYDWKGAK